MIHQTTWNLYLYYNLMCRNQNLMRHPQNLSLLSEIGVAWHLWASYMAAAPLQLPTAELHCQLRARLQPTVAHIPELKLH